MNDDTIREYEQRHVLHPWRPQKAAPAFVCDRAHGNYFYDSAGRQYLDFSSQFVVTSLGHTDARVVEAIAAQAAKLPYVNPAFATAPKAQLAKHIADITPGDIDHSFFSGGGAEANEAALKMIRLATGKNKVITRYRGYHGSLWGMLALSGDYRSWACEPSVGGVVHCLEPYCYRCPFGTTYPACDLMCARHVEDIIIKEGGAKRVAAFMAEPIIGAGGVIVPPDGYWQEVRAICDRHDVALIVDEIMVGVGRTGKWFAVDNWGVTPDIVTMAKGITSGYMPLGVTAVRPWIADHFAENAFPLGHTYSGHAMAMAAGVAAIEAYIEDDLLARCAERGEYLLARALTLKDKHPSVGDVRGMGLFVGLELVKSRKTKEPSHDPFVEPPRPPTGKLRVLAAAMERGVYIMPAVASTLTLSPPFTISEAEIDHAIAVLDDALALADAEYAE